MPITITVATSLHYIMGHMLNFMFFAGRPEESEEAHRQEVVLNQGASVGLSSVSPLFAHPSSLLNAFSGPSLP
jgi:hypothetical protein